MPPSVQSPFSEQTAMGWWDQSLRIFQGLGAHGTQGRRRMAPQTGRSKRRVHRLPPAMERRGGPPAAWRWATEAGRRGVTRRVVATLERFGGPRGGGRDTMRAVGARRRLETPGGGAPAAWRGGRQALAAARRETAGAWEQAGRAAGEGRERLGAGEAPCCAPRRRGVLERKTGARRRAEGAEARTALTGKAAGEPRRQALGTGGQALGRDRAKALRPCAAPGLACCRRPAGFPLLPAIVTRSALARGRRVRPGPQARTDALEAVARLQGRPPAAPAAPEAPAGVATRHAEGPRWAEAPPPLARPPCRMADAAPQTSPQGASPLQAPVEASAVGAPGQAWPARQAAITPVRQP